MRPAILTIPQPCPANWDDMTPTTTGSRHCTACQKTVVDFTQKTDAELLRYFQSAAGEICGQLRPDQLNRALAMPPAPGGTGGISQWRAWLLAALAFGSSLRAPVLAQAPSRQHARPPGQRPAAHGPGSQLLRGRVRDAATRQPLAGVAIFLRGQNRSARTDSAGRFRLRLPARAGGSGSPHLVLHFAGYHSQTVLPAPGATALEVLLQADSTANGVQVVGHYVARRSDMTGGAICMIQAPAPRRLPRRVFDWLTRPLRH